MKCKNCGNKIPYMFEICPNCSHSINENQAEITKKINIKEKEKLSIIDTTSNQNASMIPILSEIEKIQNPDKSILKNLGILTISIIIFFSLGFINKPVLDIILIILVIFFHETGHLLGMLLFKYKNIQMFFIPFFGAAVQGQKTNKSGFKDGIVTLLGPVPGILIALVLIIFFDKNNATIKQVALTLLFINGFNLLPIYPLDGGRLLDTIIFHRNKVIQLIFQILAVLLIIFFAYNSKDYIFILFGILIAFTIQHSYRSTKIAQELKSVIAISDNNREELFKENFETIYNKIINDYPQINKPSLISQYIIMIWDKITFKSPSLIKSIILSFTYISSLLLLILSVTFLFYNQMNSKLESIVDSNGKNIIVQRITFQDKLISENEIVDHLYHGKSKEFSITTGKISKEGFWYYGKWDKEWKFYNDQDELIRIDYFDKGKFKYRKELINGKWEKKELNDLTNLEKRIYIEHESNKQLGPGNYNFNN